jgi:hypothetical protein
LPDDGSAGVTGETDSTVEGEKVRDSIVIVRWSSFAFSVAISSGVFWVLANRRDRWFDVPKMPWTGAN